MKRWTVLALTVATGFTGLVYEVTWQKYLATLLGSHSEATAAVLGLFLGGLALGYALFGRLTLRWVDRAEAAGRPPRLLFSYGLVEAAIGLYAVVFPWLFTAVQKLSFAIPHGAGGAGFVLDVGLSALLLLPPTILMGATIPVLTQALARSLDDATRFHAFVYAFNTVGAFAGALAAGFVLIPALGLVGVMRAMAGINLAAGAAFLALGWRARDVVRLHGAAADDGAGAPPAFVAYATVACLVGFAMMTVQTILIRLGGLSFGSSEYTFAMVVAVFVLCIALGSFLVSALPRISPTLLLVTLWILVLVLYGLYHFLPQAPYWIHVLRTLFRDHDAAFLPYYFAGFLSVLAVIGPAVILSGAVLPLLFHALRHEVGDLGAVAGRLYSWNTVGSLLGALLGGYAFFFWLDLHHVYRLAVGALVVAAALLTARRADVPTPIGATALVALFGGALWLQGPWHPEMLSAGLFRKRQPMPFTGLGPAGAMAEYWEGRKIVFYQDDPTVTVTVTENMSEDIPLNRSIVTNGKPDGNTRFDYTTMGLVAVVPALLADRMERGFVIGFGTGVTAGELGALDSMREVVVAEISSGVLEAAPLFDFANQNASQNPKIRFVRSDAYRALVRSEGTYDVIISEPSNPWVTGVEMLFSQEFLTTARDRLSPGGVYAQWFHQYETNAESIEMVLRTYRSVFDQVAVWYTQHSDLMLLGFRDPREALDLRRITQRFGRPDVQAAMRRSGIDGLGSLLIHELLPLGVVRAADLPGPVHTLLRPRLSHTAGRAFYGGQAASLPFTGYGEPARIGKRNSLLRRLIAAASDAPGEAFREQITRQACVYRTQQCAALLAVWRQASPESDRYEKTLAMAQEQRLAFGGRLNPAVVPQVQSLLPTPAPPPPRPVPLPIAEQSLLQYPAYYLHAFPFDPERLRNRWQRCSPDERRPGACHRGRELTADLLEKGRPVGVRP